MRRWTFNRYSDGNSSVVVTGQRAVSGDGENRRARNRSNSDVCRRRQMTDVTLSEYAYALNDIQHGTFRVLRIITKKCHLHFENLFAEILISTLVVLTSFLFILRS